MEKDKDKDSFKYKSYTFNRVRKLAPYESHGDARSNYKKEGFYTKIVNGTLFVSTEKSKVWKKKEDMLRKKRESKILSRDEIQILNVLKGGPSGRKTLTYNTIKKRTNLSESSVAFTLGEMRKKGIVRAKKVYKELPGGRGLSRKFRWKYELK